MSFFSPTSTLNAGHGPMYLQLERVLRTAIDEGRLTDSDALPPERDLATRYGISRLTVRKALSELQRKGLVVRRRGMGTFVASQTEEHPQPAVLFQEDMVGTGLVTRGHWDVLETGPVTGSEAMTFGVAPGSRVTRLRRVRHHNDQPVAVEHATVIGDHLKPGTTIETSLYAALQAGGQPPARSMHRIRAVTLPDDISEVLNVGECRAGLFVERRGFLKDGRIIEVTSGWYTSDASDLIVDVTVPET